MTELTTVTTVGKPSEPNSSPRLGDGFQELIDELDTLAVNGGADSRNIPTGFLELDELTRGLAPGTLTVIGSHPGVGSSTLAMDFARSCAIQSGIPAAYLTLDTLPEAMRQRMLSAEAKVQLRHMLAGAMPEADWTRLARRMSEIADAPLDIQRPPERDIAQLAGQITDMAEQHGTRLVVIDPLHQLTARHDLPYENREREIAEVTRRLKTLALDLRIAIVTTANLSSNPGPRQPIPVRPSLFDLRDSGVIGHVADLVVLIDRPDAWERDHARGGEVDLILAKHRHGATGIFTVAHQLHLCRMVDMAKGSLSTPAPRA